MSHFRRYSWNLWRHIYSPLCEYVRIKRSSAHNILFIQRSCNLAGSHSSHDDVIKWKHFPRNWPFVRGIHWSPVNSPHKSQWRGALMFSLICVWINDWVNNGEAGDLRRYRIHYAVTVMLWKYILNIFVNKIWQNWAYTTALFNSEWWGKLRWCHTVYH